MISINEAIQFIRSCNCLKQWTDLDIYGSIALAVVENNLIYTAINGKIVGIAFGKEVRDEKRFHVICMCAPKQLKLYIKYFKDKFPDYIISANRRSKYIVYNF